MKNLALLVSGLSIALITGCSGAKETLGFTRQSPDEYTAVERPPLSMPPSYHLNAPTDSRNVEESKDSQRDQAAEVFLGEGKAASAKSTQGGDVELLNLANATNGSSDIRHQLDEETSHLVKKDQQFTDKLLFWKETKESAAIVDPVAEKQRIDVNKKDNKALNEGASKPIENKKTAPLEGLLN